MVKLYKRQVKYQKNGEERTTTNFYLRCGNGLIPIEVKYFKNKETETDERYAGRKLLLSAFAEDLPDKPEAEKPTEKPPA